MVPDTAHGASSHSRPEMRIETSQDSTFLRLPIELLRKCIFLKKVLSLEGVFTL